MNALNYSLKMKLQLSLGWNKMNIAQGHYLLSCFRNLHIVVNFGIKPSLGPTHNE